MGRSGWVVALILAGCAAPSPQRPAEGERFAFHTVLTPYSAAICIARNGRQRPGASAEERTQGESGTEVVVRDGAGLLAVARIDRNGPASSNVSIRVSERVPGDPRAFARSLMASC